MGVLRSTYTFSHVWKEHSFVSVYNYYEFEVGDIVLSVLQSAVSFPCAKTCYSVDMMRCTICFAFGTVMIKDFPSPMWRSVGGMVFFSIKAYRAFRQLEMSLHRQGLRQRS